MTARYLIDTDWTIHWLNGNERIRQRIEELRTQRLGIAATPSGA